MSRGPTKPLSALRDGVTHSTVPVPNTSLTLTTIALILLDRNGDGIASLATCALGSSPSFWRAATSVSPSIHQSPQYGPMHPGAGICELAQRNIRGRAQELSYTIARIIPEMDWVGALFPCCIHAESHPRNGWLLVATVLLAARQPAKTLRHAPWRHAGIQAPERGGGQARRTERPLGGLHRPTSPRHRTQMQASGSSPATTTACSGGTGRRTRRDSSTSSLGRAATLASPISTVTATSTRSGAGAHTGTSSQKPSQDWSGTRTVCQPTLQLRSSSPRSLRWSPSPSPLRGTVPSGRQPAGSASERRPSGHASRCEANLLGWGVARRVRA